MSFEWHMTSHGFQMNIGAGLGILFVSYYPIKLVVFLVNRFKKGKWEWPIGYQYSYLPILILLIMFFGG